MERFKIVRESFRRIAPCHRTPGRYAAFTGYALEALFVILVLAQPSYADSPWEKAVEVLRDSFTGPIARGLSLVAIVVGGIMWAFGDGDKRSFAGIVFGVGMAVGAVNFLNWLFP